MTKSLLLAGSLVCLAAGVLTFVTAASLGRREAAVVQTEPIVTEVDDAPVTEPATWMTEYTLTERSGRKFESSELDGKVHIVNFFFSSCPSVCRQQSGKVQELAEEFGPQGVVFLSITCDPQNDNPATLTQYAKLFNADQEDWLFLTSEDLTYLRRVGSEVYQVPVDKQVHSERLVVVDREGEIHGAYHWNTPSEMAELKLALKNLLKTEAPEEVVAADKG